MHNKGNEAFLHKVHLEFCAPSAQFRLNIEIKLSDQLSLVIGMSTKDTRLDIDSRLAGLDIAAWFSQMEDIADDLGSYDFLGKYHAAALIEAGPKLLVTFENASAVIDRSASAEPVGFHFVRYDGWSHLGLYASGDSWYRDPYIYAYFDRLTDEGFFDAFDDVLFYGVNGGGYAAAAYSVAAPGARVLALRPQATLNPRITGFDLRFRKMRRLDFTSRYGYAPEMLEGAQQAYVVYDPQMPYDAMQAALFTRKNVSLRPCNGFGGQIEQSLEMLEIKDEVIRAAMDGKLTDEVFGRLMRARRTHAPYLRRLFHTQMTRNRKKLAANVCAHAIRHGHTKFFSERLKELQDLGFQPFRPVKAVG